jgi:formylglycine-generating enzyme required for sulfatase activity
MRTAEEALDDIAAVPRAGGKIHDGAYYVRDYYQHQPPRQDPAGPNAGDRHQIRVVRGGAGTRGPLESRSAWRYGHPQSDRQNDRGFRILMLPTSPGPGHSEK